MLIQKEFVVWHLYQQKFNWISKKSLFRRNISTGVQWEGCGISVQERREKKKSGGSLVTSPKQRHAPTVMDDAMLEATPKKKRRRKKKSFLQQTQSATFCAGASLSPASLYTIGWWATWVYIYTYISVQRVHISLTWKCLEWFHYTK